jgi:TPR repeat protein
MKKRARNELLNCMNELLELLSSELYDEILFKQPESSHLGDCPICLLPLPIDPKSSNFTILTCCIKAVCKGCTYANQLREMEQSLDQRCPFCRHRMPQTKAEADKNIMKRAEANDPAAFRELGRQRRNDGDYGSAFEYYSKAAELGDVHAHYQLACLYRIMGNVKKDYTKKAIYHWERAAIGGHPIARYILGEKK